MEKCKKCGSVSNMNSGERSCYVDCKGGCWIGPDADTETEAESAWDELMRVQPVEEKRAEIESLKTEIEKLRAELARLKGEK